MIRPTPRCVLLFGLGLPVALIPTLMGGDQWPMWLAFLILCLLLVCVDLVRLLPRRFLAIDVKLPGEIFIGEQGGVRVRVDTGGWKRSVAIEMLLDVPEDFEGQKSGAFTVDSDGLEFSVPLRPRRRGTHGIPMLWVRWWSPLGLLMSICRHPIEGEVRVVPNVRAVRNAALRFFSNRDYMAGLKVERYLGDGSEFESLREFMPGFDHRSIDWKASARHRKLMSRQFQAERNHQVVLALDSGYLMREPLAGIPRLDHAINAGLFLSYIALKSGDRVGLFSFDDRVRSYMKPQPGAHVIHALQHQSAHIEYATSETNFTLSLGDLAARLRRRSLIVLFTDFADTVTAELMIHNLQLLARRHVIVFVTLRDPGLQQLTRGRIDSIEDLNSVVVGETFVQERRVVHRRLEHSGVMCIDALPGQVSVDLVNQYLDVRRREMV